MVSDSAKKRLEAKKAAKSAKLHGSAKTVSISISEPGKHPHLILKCKHFIKHLMASGPIDALERSPLSKQEAE